MRQLLRDHSVRGFIHRHPLFVNLVLIVLVAGPGYLRLENISNSACEDRRDQAVLLRGLVELSDDGTGRIHLTGFPSFKDLDPDTQRYLTDVENASKQAPRPSEFVRHALELVQVPDCN